MGQRAPGTIEDLDLDQLDQLACQVEPGARPVVLVGFSAGGWFTLLLATRVRWNLQGLLLLEPMGLPAIEVVNSADAGGEFRRAFERYFVGVDTGRPDAIETIMDVWYQPGAHAAMPDHVKDYLRALAQFNVRDGRAALHARFDRATFSDVAVRTVATYETAGRSFGGNSPKRSPRCCRTQRQGQSHAGHTLSSTLIPTTSPA